MATVATDISVLGYIRLLCPVLGVTSNKVSIAYLSQHCQSRCQSQLFLECVAGLNDRKGCIFTNDMKLTRQNMKYFVFILSAMKYKSK